MTSARCPDFIYDRHSGALTLTQINSFISTSIYFLLPHLVWRAFMPASSPVPTLFRDRLMEAPCTRCGAKMKLARIEPARPGYDLRTFECTKCNNADQFIVEYETSSPWVLVVRGS